MVKDPFDEDAIQSLFKNLIEDGLWPPIDEWNEYVKKIIIGYASEGYLKFIANYDHIIMMQEYE